MLVLIRKFDQRNYLKFQNASLDSQSLQKT